MAGRALLLFSLAAVGACSVSTGGLDEGGDDDASAGRAGAGAGGAAGAPTADASTAGSAGADARDARAGSSAGGAAGANDAGLAGAGARDDGGGYADADGGVPLPCDPGFSFSTHPITAMDAFEVTYEDLPGHVYVDMTVSGPGAPMTAWKGVTGSGPFQWTWTVTGHDAGVLAFTFFRDKRTGEPGEALATCQVESRSL